MQSSVKDLLASSNVTQTTQSELDLFIKFSDILSIHLRDIQCILGRLQRLFIVYIEKTYRVFTVSEARIISLVEDVNQFLLLMREAVTDYYRLGIFRDPQW